MLTRKQYGTHICEPYIYIYSRYFAESWLNGRVLRILSSAFGRALTSETGESFINADGFGITWHTDERSNFNPLIELEAMGKEVPERSFADTLDDIIRIYDGPLISYVRGPHPAMYKTTIAKPWVSVAFFALKNFIQFHFRLNDPSFLSLCANISSKCIFAHLRAAEEPPVATTNNHPFVFGRHCFMHNGNIENFGKIVSSSSFHMARALTGEIKRKEVLDNVSPGFTAMIEGGTDTEHLAALYMTYLCEPKDFRGADNRYPTSSMWMALKAAINKVEGIQRSRGMNPDNHFNICTSTRPSSFCSHCTNGRLSGWREPSWNLLPHYGLC